ncbi:MAG TPA: hypothetical protein VGT44_07750 [Ktedonobacteraceae bacterium]|nr:hypothetical protein [Ktedonobacteraceae bacterium]
MSDQDMEMQFADPDWQPASARPGRYPGEQARAVPFEIKHAPASNPQADGQPATRLWTSGPGQTPPWTIQPTSADASRGTGQRQKKHQQQPAPARLKSRQQRWLLGLLARVAVVVIWVTTPLVTRAFHGGWIVPLLGVLFLPVTALTYAVVFALAGGVTGLGWLWIAGAVLLDLASHAGQSNKRSSGQAQHTSKDATLSTEGQ